jgi:hypothetical protein
MEAEAALFVPGAGGETILAGSSTYAIRLVSKKLSSKVGWAYEDQGKTVKMRGQCLTI